MTKSETINELAAALAKAQGEIKGAIEDSSNPHFRSKYASLQSYIDAARGPLSKYGLSVTQLLTDTGCELNMVTIETVLLHSSGQWISSTFSVPIGNKQDAQAYGSACTYARRYSFAAIVGIAPVDDDAQAAVRQPEQPVSIKADKLPMTILKAINAFKDKDELFKWAATQEYKQHPQFRQAVQARKEALA